MNNPTAERINALRSQMLLHGIDAVIIPQTDPHQSEYISDHWQVRRYFSGFTGSAGSLVVTAKAALLWTDSRYFIQAAQQLSGTEVELMKDGLPATPSIESYLTSNLPAGSCVGIDGMLFSSAAAEKLQYELEAHGLKLVTDFDVVDNIWTDRPALPKDKIFVHDTKYTRDTAKTKLAAILADAKRQMADTALISPLDEIAWTLNIRCSDVKYNPVATAYLYVAPERSTLFIDPDKLSAETSDYLHSEGVDTLPYSDIKLFVENLSPDVKVLVEEARTSTTLATLLGDRAVYGVSPVAVSKACKNDVQVQGIRNAMTRDGVALVKAFKEIEETIANHLPLTELDVEAILRKYRSSMDLYFDESFGTIAGYGAHGAIVHYEADESSSATIEPQGLLLVDSGAQYLDGTTDITRTIAMGVPTQMEKHDFTLVMKGHIALAQMIFPEGTRGAQLDVEARKFLWREGLTYLHGTGHGVGHFLNVHEGPQSIRLNYTPTPLMPGMITSNEPGLYRENIHGIRCENLVLCVNAMTTEFGEFLKFETLTLFPFDLKLFETEIMTDDEIEWVNDYHRQVREALSQHLNDEERKWLETKTAELKK